MDEVKLNMDENGQGAFHIMDGAEKIGEMVIGIAGNELTVFHTEVAPQAEGKGMAKKMFVAMADHARSNSLKVLPQCAYVQAQLKRGAGEYKDIWEGAENTE